MAVSGKEEYAERKAIEGEGKERFVEGREGRE